MKTNKEVMLKLEMIDELIRKANALPFMKQRNG